MNLIHFQSPSFLWLLGLIFLLVLLYLTFIFKNKNFQKHSNLIFLKTNKSSWAQAIVHFSFFINILIMVVIVLALAQPQTKIGESLNKANGVDIIFVLDISSSMSFEDFTPDRLAVAKEQIINFIEQRENDRMGLVVFGKSAFLQSPLTFDRNFLKAFVREVTFLNDIQSQTAIGSALATAVIALKNSLAKSKVIILLTDGNNNTGEIDPITASTLAKNNEIKIYTVGIGKPGRSIVSRTIYDPFLNKKTIPVEIFMDEKILTTIAKITGGFYFNVQNELGFSTAYKKIDNLEKTEIENIDYSLYEDYFYELIFISIIMLIFYLFLMAYFEPENN